MDKQTFLDLPYQREGAQWLASQPRAGLADEQGLGKTVEAIMAADMIDARRTVVVCPAKARSTWEAEFAERSTLKRALRTMSYEQATEVFDNVRPTSVLPDLLIIDEAHYLKNWQSGRTQSIYPKTQNIPHVWSLTGTPIPNGRIYESGEITGDISELWTHFYYLNHAIIGGMTPGQFIEAYGETCRAYGGEMKVVAPKAERELELRGLFAKLWKRRMLADVNLQLPPMRTGEIVLQAPYPADVERIARDQGVLFVDPWLLPVGDEALATMRKLTASAKAPPLADFVAEELTNNPDEKLVIFAWHTEAIDILAERLRKFGVVIVDGRTPDAHVQERVDRFQTDERCRVFIGQILAAGTCLTLTAASNIIFLECSWVPSQNDQAQRRIQRIGQTAKSLLCRYAILKGSSDEAVTRVLARKTKQRSS